MATAPDTAERNNTQILVIVGLIVALLGVVYFMFLRGDGDGEPTAAAPSPTSVAPLDPDPDDDAVPEEEEVPKQGPVETFEVFAARDPFKPLVTQSTTGATGGTTGTTTTSGTTGTTGGTGGTGTGSTDGTGGTSGSGGSTGSGSSGGQSSSGKTVSGHRVKLVDVFTKDGKQKAQVQVDSTVYTVDEGERFADNFKLLSISGQCASMLFGDDQFTLCEGEEILK